MESFKKKGRKITPWSFYIKGSNRNLKWMLWRLCKISFISDITTSIWKWWWFFETDEYVLRIISNQRKGSKLLHSIKMYLWKLTSDAISVLILKWLIVDIKAKYVVAIDFMPTSVYNKQRSVLENSSWFFKTQDVFSGMIHLSSEGSVTIWERQG